MGGKGKGGGGGKFQGKGGGAFPTTQVAGGGGGETYGSDLHIRDLAAKTDRVLADVTQFALSKDGQLLIYTVASRKEETNGVYAVNPRSGGSAAAIKIGPGRYTGLTWDEKQTKLAFLYDDSAVKSENQAPAPRRPARPLEAPLRSCRHGPRNRSGGRSSGTATRRQSRRPSHGSASARRADSLLS